MIEIIVKIQQRKDVAGKTHVDMAIEQRNYAPAFLERKMADGIKLFFPEYVAHMSSEIGATYDEKQQAKNVFRSQGNN